MRRERVAVLDTVGPDDGLEARSQVRPLIPSGRWILDAIVAGLEQRGVDVVEARATPYGYWVVHLVDAGGLGFRVTLSDLKGVFVICLVELRGVVDWVRRRGLSREGDVVFDAICSAVRSDSRVRAMYATQGTKTDTDEFVGKAIDRLGRERQTPGVGH